MSSRCHQRKDLSRLAWLLVPFPDGLTGSLQNLYLEPEETIPELGHPQDVPPWLATLPLLIVDQKMGNNSGKQRRVWEYECL